jgi:hypothetical protein
MSMQPHFLPRASGAIAFALLSLPLALTWAQDSQATQKETAMTVRAQGTFNVDVKPLAEDEGWGGFARMSIDKHIQGDLEAETKGVMLAAQTEVKGSAGYVAFERVTGKLAGRSGSFILQHSGMMWDGGDSLSISVVTDSGTGELKGISGSFEIIFKKEVHEYVFDYSFSTALKDR